MANRDPQQELFTELLLRLKEAGYAVYDGFMPPEGTDYPFIYLGDCQQTDDANKTAIFGNVLQVIHIWHNNPKQRGTVSDLMLAVKAICWKIGKTANYSWHFRNPSQRIITDTTTKTPLLHGVIEANFYFS